MEQKENQIRMRVMNMPERISDMCIYIETQRKKSKQDKEEKNTLQ